MNNIELACVQIWMHECKRWLKSEIKEFYIGWTQNNLFKKKKVLISNTNSFHNLFHKIKYTILNLYINAFIERWIITKKNSR